MDKSPDAFRTISEVADDLDMPQHVLRFWETRFTQIKPLKRGGGRRYYRPDDVDLLKGLRRLLYGEGYTIKGVQRILKEQGARHVVAIGRGAPVAKQNHEDEVAEPDAAYDAPPISRPAPQPHLATTYSAPSFAHHQPSLSEPDAIYHHELQDVRGSVSHAPAIGAHDVSNRLKAALFELGEARAELARIKAPQPSSVVED